MVFFYLFLLVAIVVTVFWLIPRSEKIGEWFIDLFKPENDEEEK